MDSIDDWATRAACLGLDPDALFVQGAAQNRAKAICFGCPVRTECLADSLDHRIEFGVWGGMTERERRGLLRRRPDVTSWRHLLETARDEHDRAHDVVPDPAAVPTLPPAAVPVPAPAAVPAPAPAAVPTLPPAAVPAPPAVPVRPLAPSLPYAS